MTRLIYLSVLHFAWSSRSKQWTTFGTKLVMRHRDCLIQNAPCFDFFPSIYRMILIFKSNFSCAYFKEAPTSTKLVKTMISESLPFLIHISFNWFFNVFLHVSSHVITSWLFFTLKSPSFLSWATGQLSTLWPRIPAFLLPPAACLHILWHFTSLCPRAYAVSKPGLPKNLGGTGRKLTIWPREPRLFIVGWILYCWLAGGKGGSLSPR